MSEKPITWSVEPFGPGVLVTLTVADCTLRRVLHEDDLRGEEPGASLLDAVRRVEHFAAMWHALADNAALAEVVHAEARAMVAHPPLAGATRHMGGP